MVQHSPWAPLAPKKPLSASAPVLAQQTQQCPLDTPCLHKGLQSPLGSGALPTALCPEHPPKQERLTALPSPGLFGAGPRKQASWLHGPGDPDTHGLRPRGRGHSYYLLGLSFTLQVCVSKARQLPLNLNVASGAQTQPSGTRVCMGSMGAATLQRKLLIQL